jgi:histidine triad (HIT) family protein
VVADGCVFCAIVAGESPAEVVHEWRDVLAIVPLDPVVKGHVIVLPKDHVQDALADPFITATVVQRAAELAHRPANIITSAGGAATQTVFHLHVHIVPRRAGDGLLLPWTGQVPVGERQWIFPMDAKVDALMADGTHRYWSTHCRHGHHDLCSAAAILGVIPDSLGVVTSISRRPAQCKDSQCQAPCVCPCHTPEADRG